MLIKFSHRWEPIKPAAPVTSILSFIILNLYLIQI
jgi:hypothetical protein